MSKCSCRSSKDTPCEYLADGRFKKVCMKHTVLPGKTHYAAALYMILAPTARARSARTERPIVVMDKGAGKSATTTTGRSDVYAFIFGQKGLMYNLTLEGSKFIKLDKR